MPRPRQRGRDAHLEGHLPIGLALRVDPQGRHAAAAERLRDQKVEGMQAGRLEAFDRTGGQVTQLREQAFGGDLPAQQCQEARLTRDDGDIRGIALVAGTRIGETRERQIDGRLVRDEMCIRDRTRNRCCSIA